jgi:16S rRNA (cytosine967-C5)-methyltransferase
MTERELSQGQELALLDRTEPLILSLWQRTRMDWGFVATRLSRAFREQRIGARERRFVSETLYGLVRHLRRIDEALAHGGLVSANRAPDRERLLAYLVLEGMLDPAEAARRAPGPGRGIDWNRIQSIDEVIAREKSESVRLARLYSVPDWIAARLCADHGDDAGPLLAALNARAPMTVRVNTLKTTLAECASTLAREDIATHAGTLSPWALTVDTRVNLFSLDAFQKGWFEAQDEGSQLIAELVAPPPKAIVIDGCAGAGGKTLAIAASMSDRGRIIASDPDAKKLTELKRRARRAGVSNTQAVTISDEPGAALPASLEGLWGRAHRVLLDVPCTGIGALRRNPEIRWRLDEGALERMPALQSRLIDTFLPLVRDGGRLIYATCSLFHAENRRVIQEALARHPQLELVPVKEVFGGERARTMTGDDGTFLELLPHRQGTDGFFAAVLRRRATT